MLPHVLNLVRLCRLEDNLVQNLDEAFLNINSSREYFDEGADSDDGDYMNYSDTIRSTEQEQVQNNPTTYLNNIPTGKDVYRVVSSSKYSNADKFVLDSNIATQQKEDLKIDSSVKKQEQQAKTAEKLFSSSFSQSGIITEKEDQPKKIL